MEIQGSIFFGSLLTLLSNITQEIGICMDHKSGGGNRSGGMMISWLHEQNLLEVLRAIYCNTTLNKADMNAKAHGGQALQEKHMLLVGYKFYPPKGTKHYRLLELDKYNIGIHCGSFLLQADKNANPNKDI